MKPDLYLASISDIHLGHPKTQTLHITTNLCRAFPDSESTHLLDVIFFGGDLFDRLLSLNQPDVPQILEWAGNFIKMCGEHKIHFVLMEGTPSHDWGQSRMLGVLQKLGLGNKYFHYITDLSIVHFDDLGIDVLFVPDEWKQQEPDDTWKEVKELMRERNLDKVDFTILHGTFDFQLPEHVKVPRHVLARYEEITRFRIYGAHIHEASSRGKVRVNGSFDRIAHGEESAKGHWRTKFVNGKIADEIFVVNKFAKIYKTLDCSGMELDAALSFIEKEVSKLPNDSHVRIKAAKSDTILGNLETIRKRWPDMHWSTKATESETIQKTLFVDQRAVFDQIQITPDNIASLLSERLPLLTNDGNLLEQCKLRIKELI